MGTVEKAPATGHRPIAQHQSGYITASEYILVVWVRARKLFCGQLLVGVVRWTIFGWGLVSSVFLVKWYVYSLRLRAWSCQYQ